MGVLFAPFLRVSPKIVPPEREPTILGETFGTRARGRPRTAPPRRRHVMPLAMRPLRDQMAHCRRTLRLPSALTRSPRRSRGLTPCERLVSGSTPNKITSCQATSRSCCSLDRLRKGAVVLGDAPKESRRAQGCPLMLYIKVRRALRAKPQRSAQYYKK